jgi:AraC-like DNA-binding protein
MAMRHVQFATSLMEMPCINGAFAAPSCRMKDIEAPRHIQQEGMVRVAPLLPAFAVFERLNVSADRVLESCEIPASLFSHPENPIAFSDGCRFLQTCAATADCEHFGLLMAEDISAATLGVAGELMQNHADLGSALCSLIRNLHLHDQGAVPFLNVDNGYAHLGYMINDYHACGTTTVLDLSMGIALKLVRGLCGNQWHPAETRISRRPPADEKPYADLFESPVRFNTPFSALVFKESELRRRILRADRTAARKSQVQDQIRIAEQLASAIPFPAQIRRLLRPLLAMRRNTVADAADLMDIHRRTLNRRLRESGLTFRALMDQASYDHARSLLAETDIPLAQIATALGYADASTFNRRFRQWSETTPGQWRAEHRVNWPASTL